MYIHVCKVMYIHITHIQVNNTYVRTYMYAHTQCRGLSKLQCALVEHYQHLNKTACDSPNTQTHTCMYTHTHTHTHCITYLHATCAYMHVCTCMCTCTCSFKFEHTYCRCVNWCDIPGSAHTNQIPTHYPLLSIHTHTQRHFPFTPARDNTYRYHYAMYMYIVTVAIIATHSPNQLSHVVLLCSLLASTYLLDLQYFRTAYACICICILAYTNSQVIITCT